jgi:Tol biopolymer transport system component
MAGRDGREIFFWGDTNRSDLQLLDPRTQTFSPFLPGRAVGMLGFSRDFQQVAYSENYKLWRIRANGEDAQLIHLGGLRAFYPRWSPDGRTLAFGAEDQAEAHNVYTIDADGGVPKPVLPGVDNPSDPDWSPDGSQIVLVRQWKNHSVLSLVFRDGRDRGTDMPDSADLVLPRWSPRGRFLAATSADLREIRLYDFARRAWRVAARATALGQAAWPMDGARIFYQDMRAAGLPVYAFDIHSAATNTVARFDKALHAGNLVCGFVGLAQGDMPVIEVERSSPDLYGAEIEFP